VARPGLKGCDEAILLALAAGGNADSAAKHAGVCAKTVRRRLADPAFRARIDQARADMVSAAVGRLADIGSLAVNTLHDLAQGAKTPPAVKLGAARAVLEYMFRGIEIDILARQVAALQQQVNSILKGVSSGHGDTEGPDAEAPGARSDTGSGERDGDPASPAPAAPEAADRCRDDPRPISDPPTLF
jgi:hypothetical protein